MITVEDEARPDPSRRAPAFFDVLHGRCESVVLPFASDDGRRRLRQLLSSVDVVIEGTRPRVLQRLGIDAEVLVARGPQVWVSITGHGRRDPHDVRVGYGDDAAFAGGLVGWRGEWHEFPPVFLADAVADPLTGLTAASTVVQLLRSGGRHLVDIALARCAAAAAPREDDEVLPATPVCATPTARPILAPCARRRCRHRRRAQGVRRRLISGVGRLHSQGTREEESSRRPAAPSRRRPMMSEESRPAYPPPPLGQSTPVVVTETTTGRRLAPDSLVAGTVGLVFVVVGLLAAIRAGIDASLRTPVMDVLGFSHTALLGIVEFGVGVALLLAALAVSRSGAVAIGLLVGIGSFVAAVETDRFRESLAIESAFAWMGVAAAAIVVSSALLMPRAARSSRSGAHRRRSGVRTGDDQPLAGVGRAT